MKEMNVANNSELTERHGSFLALSDDITDALIKQYEHELNNAQIYLAFSSWAHIQGYPRTAEWFDHQYAEEVSHSLLIFNFLKESGIHFFIPKIEITQIEISSCVDLYLEALKLEIITTESLNHIAKISGENNQFIVQDFINKMLVYQLEEEDEARIRYKVMTNTSDFLFADQVIGTYVRGSYPTRF